MSIGTKISEIRKSKKMKIETLSQKSGVPISTLKKILSGATKDPQIDTIKAIARALECTLEDFDDNSNLKNYSAVEKKLIADYRKLDDHSKEVVQVVIRKELERNIPSEPNYDNIIPIKKYQVPYYDMPVSAGTGNPLDEEYPEKVDLAEQPPKGTDFIVRVSGDSMEPTYHDGDKLFVKEQPSIEIGEIGIFVVDGNAYVKELGVDRLISHNEKYSDIIINEYIRNECCGKVLGICEETF
nr:MAG TPA: Repressor protein CI [Caudoviricetes sp.]